MCLSVRENLGLEAAQLPACKHRRSFVSACEMRHSLRACCTNSPLALPLLAGRNDIAASMAAAEQEERPAEVGAQAWLGHLLAQRCCTLPDTVQPRALLIRRFSLQPVPCRRL